MYSCDSYTRAILISAAKIVSKYSDYMSRNKPVTTAHHRP